jgi:hypothetical protein
LYGPPVIERLPEFPLRPAGPASAAFLERGVERYQAAADLVMRLPYGRGAARDDLAVLGERRGTCSTKHALLARLAREHEVEVELLLGIYMMNDRSTPGVGGVLAAHGLQAIPEAHCLLRWRGELVDVTRPEAQVPVFLYEQVIAPEDIVERKIGIHRRYLAQWVVTNLPGWTLDSLWRAREACITALGSGAQDSVRIRMSPPDSGSGW